MKKIRNVVFGIVAIVFVFGFANKSEAATPLIKEVTLACGESVETEVMVFSSTRYFSTAIAKVRATSSSQKEMYAVDIIDIENPSNSNSYYFYQNASRAGSIFLSGPERRMVTFRLTNLSASPITYLFGVSTGMGTFTDSKGSYTFNFDEIEFAL